MTSCRSHEELQKHQHPTERKTARVRVGDQRATIARYEDDAPGICRRGALRRTDLAYPGTGPAAEVEPYRAGLL